MSMLQVKLVALLVLFAEVFGKSPCTVQSQNANCYNRRIVDIPQELSNDITHLYLGNNHIKTIKTADLQRYRQLKLVYIDKNKLETVDVEAFAHLTQLQVVDLSHNRLTHVNNTIFTNNTNLMSLRLNGNNLLCDPASPFLISPSIEELLLVSCGISQITNVTFSKMENLKFLSITENNILSLDPSSFYYNPLQILYIDYEEEIKSTIIELICKNVKVFCFNDPQNVCQRDSIKELKCNLNIPNKSTMSLPKESYFASVSRHESETIQVGVESTTEVKDEVKFNLTRSNESTNSSKYYSVSAKREETVTFRVRAKSTIEMMTQSIAMDRVLVFASSSFVLIFTGLSLTVLVLYLEKRKGKTNGSKPETSSSPEYQFALVENDEVNDGYEVARNDTLFQENQYILVLRDQVNDGYEVARKDYLIQKQPDVLPLWPSVRAPQRPLPSPPLTRSSINSYHEYEEIRDQ